MSPMATTSAGSMSSDSASSESPLALVTPGAEISRSPNEEEWVTVARSPSSLVAASMNSSASTLRSLASSLTPGSVVRSTKDAILGGAMGTPRRSYGGLMSHSWTYSGSAPKPRPYSMANWTSG